MSSRRDSRVHMTARQNDALLEFENFKRKYLMVNKHITKLNSTLSVRVEELNAQVSSLYVENLRLRASEISLASQLKKEKEKTRKIVDEAESTVGTLMEYLSTMRSSLGTKAAKTDSPSSMRRKLPSSPVQPPRDTVRLVRPPSENIPQIRESDEEEDDNDETPTRMVTARRPTSSRLPLPKLLSLPQPQPPVAASANIPYINLTAGAIKRKPVRRNSGILMTEQPTGLDRASTPVNNIPRRSRRGSVDYEDEEHEVEAQIGVEAVSEVVPVIKAGESSQVNERKAPLNEFIKPTERPRKVDRKGKTTLTAGEWEAENHSNSERDSSEGTKEKERRRFGIKDVTNSPRKLSTEFNDEKVPDLPAATAILATPSLTPNSELFEISTPRAGPSALSSAASTPATDGGGSEAGDINTTGRERRTRKSVNYAEPKLNTKMRKPDPPPDSFKPRVSAGGTTTRRRRSIPATGSIAPSDEDGDADVEGAESSMRWKEGRRRTVHHTSGTSSVLTATPVHGSTPAEPYGQWGDETRRHSMAV